MDELFSFVRDGIAKRKGSWPELAEASGVSYSWISKFGTGQFPNAGYRTLEKIAAALRQQDGQA